MRRLREPDISFHSNRTMFNSRKWSFIVSLIISLSIYFSAVRNIQALSNEVTGIRDLPTEAVPDTVIDVNIQIELDELSAPNGLIVKEYVPAGWNVITADPMYNNFDPVSGEIKWLFFGGAVQDMFITYQLEVPISANGIYFFSGQLNYVIGGMEITGDIGGDVQLTINVQIEYVLMVEILGDDIQLSWTPADPQDVFVSSIGQPFSLIAAGFSPPFYQTGSYQDTIDYCYRINEPGFGWSPGELYDIDDIVGSMIYVPASVPWGFWQGSDLTEICRNNDEGTQFRHILTHDIIVMETEVSRWMWADLKSVQVTLPNDPSDLNIGPWLSDPVNQVTWFEAVLYANLLSLQNGLSRCYYKDASFTIPVAAANYTSGEFFVNLEANGYRLLLEAEWETMSRAGKSGLFPFVEANYNAQTCTDCSVGILPIIEQHAVFCANAMNGTYPVGSRLSNSWNFYDVQGNVSEWCWDWYPNAAPWYPEVAMVDYKGPDIGEYRVLRGGSWNSNAQALRSAARHCASPGSMNNQYGFRLCRRAYR